MRIFIVQEIHEIYRKLQFPGTVNNPPTCLFFLDTSDAQLRRGMLSPFQILSIRSVSSDEVFDQKIALFSVRSPKDFFVLWVCDDVMSTVGSL